MVKKKSVSFPKVVYGTFGTNGKDEWFEVTEDINRLAQPGVSREVAEYHLAEKLILTTKIERTPRGSND